MTSQRSLSAGRFVQAQALWAGSSALILAAAVLLVMVPFVSAQPPPPPEPCAPAAGATEAEKESHRRGSDTVMLVVSGVVVLSLTFEKLQHLAKHHATKHVKPIVITLINEITVLGFISLILFTLEEAGVFTPVSEFAGWGSGEEEVESFLHLVHIVHVVVFAVMIIFLLEVGVLIMAAIRQRKEWVHAELQAVEPDAVLDKFSHNMARRHRLHTANTARSCWHCCLFRCCRTRPHDAMVYNSLRHRFIMPDESNPNGPDSLPSDFNFGEYLSLRLTKVLTEIVNLTPLVWLGLEVVFAGVYSTSFFPPEVMSFVMHCISILSCTFTILLYLHLTWVFKQLTPASLHVPHPDLMNEAHIHPSRRALVKGPRVKRPIKVTPMPDVPEREPLPVPMRLEVAQPRAGKLDPLPAGDRRQPDLEMAALAPAASAAASAHAGGEAAGDHEAEAKAAPADAEAAGGGAGVPEAKAEARPVGGGIMGRSTRVTKSRYYLHPKHEVYTGRAVGSEPPYVHRVVVKRSTWCGRKCLGRPATRHEQLFWLDVKGVSAIMFGIQLQLLVAAWDLAATYLVGTKHGCGTIPECGYPTHCIVNFIIKFTTIIVIAMLLPRTITLLVMVTSVEEMKKHKTVGAVIRVQRVQRSMRVLRLLSALRSHVASLSRTSALVSSDVAGPTNLAGQAIVGAAEKVYGGATSPLYLRRKRQLTAVFDVMDVDQAGGIPVDKLDQLLHLIGRGEEASQVSDLIRAELDADDSGSIEFDELFGWMALHEASANSSEGTTEDLVTDLFNAIDTDGSGTVSLPELAEALNRVAGDSLGIEDVIAILQVADSDNSGTVSLSEFKRLCARHLYDTTGLSM